jgi:Na+/proline symporter
MVAKLTVIFFIILCLLLGVYLILLPWMSFGLIGDWGDNYLLAVVSEKADLPILRKTVTSGWIRGAVTGLGILNLFLAFWEMAHFKQSVAMLEEKETKK